MAGNILKFVINPAQAPYRSGTSRPHPPGAIGFQSQSEVIPASFTTFAHGATSALMMSPKARRNGSGHRGFSLRNGHRGNSNDDAGKPDPDGRAQLLAQEHHTRRDTD